LQTTQASLISDHSLLAKGSA